jgi:hypothetical protein
MMDDKLSRELIRRRILDNLSWGNLPYHVIEPLPPLVTPPPPPSIAVPRVEKTPGQPRSPAKKVAKKMITSIPFLGRAAIVLLTSLLWPLTLAGALSDRLQNLTRRIDDLIR